MLSWFRESAPIRTKMRVLAVVYTALVLLSGAAVAFWAGLDVMAMAPAAAVAAVTLGIAVLTARAITEPYVATVIRMEALAAGDLESAILRTEYRDCVGRMTKAMQVFRETAVTQHATEAAQGAVVDMMGDALRQVAGGDLTIRLSMPFTARYEPLRQDFNAAIDAMSQTLHAVTQSTATIHSGASEIAGASDDLSRRTEQQAASLEETAAAMDEITATVRETAAGAMRAKKVVDDTRGDAEDGGRVVRQAVDAMGGIERASNEISDIISVIDGIAFQTNLLALNAGVEAARAGDAGRGFAVVASEVRALAQRSADAAKDVKAKITASGAQVDIGVGLVGDTGRALERIMTRVAEVSTLVAAIAQSAEQQSSGLQQVNIAVGEMDSVTQQNAAMVEESTAAARNLATESDALVQHVARFRLGAGDRPVQAAAAARPAARPVAALRTQRRPTGGAPRTQGALALKLEPDADDWSSF